MHAFTPFCYENYSIIDIESDLQPDQHTIIFARRDDSMVDSQQEHQDRPTIVMSSESGQNVKPAYVSLLQKQKIRYRTSLGLYNATSWEKQQCGFRTGPTQTGLYKHRKELEA